ncbi:hypothetical protein DVH24_039274 [Malus domestica]|uniref:Uncharacterized protein n=1 Tax=Malus domestica TaxID=3750 RepID=A0A498I0Z0_MALDO|nr:hypothetical protein DVH24_039274 [Malus domestica]
MESNSKIWLIWIPNIDKIILLTLDCYFSFHAAHFCLLSAALIDRMLRLGTFGICVFDDLLNWVYKARLMARLSLSTKKKLHAVLNVLIVYLRTIFVACATSCFYSWYRFQKTP